MIFDFSEIIDRLITLVYRSHIYVEIYVAESGHSYFVLTFIANYSALLVISIFPFMLFTKIVTEEYGNRRFSVERG